MSEQTGISLAAYAAVLVYQNCTLPDRYYNYHDLIRISASGLNEAIWPGYLEEDMRVSITLDAWRWLEVRDLVHMWPVGGLTLAVGAVQEIDGTPGFQRITAWQQARNPQEFIQLADDWQALEPQD